MSRKLAVLGALLALSALSCALLSALPQPASLPPTESPTSKDTSPPPASPTVLPTPHILDSESLASISPPGTALLHPVVTQAVSCVPLGNSPPVPASIEPDTAIADGFEPQLRAYLNAGGMPDSLQESLNEVRLPDDSNEWQASAQVFSVDLTGDDQPEVIVHLSFFQSRQYSDGAVFLYRCQNGQYVGDVIARIAGQVFAAADPDPGIRAIVDLNGNGVPEVVLSNIFVIGTHANFTREFRILEWDGSAFGDLIDSSVDNLGRAQVLNGDGALADVDGDGRLDLILKHGPGNGPDADSSPPPVDVWRWNNGAFTVTRFDVPPAVAPEGSAGTFRLVAPLPEGAGPSSDVRLDLTPDGTLYATTGRQAVYLLAGDAWQPVVTAGAPAPIVGVDPVGRVWAASPETAAVWDGQGWTIYTEQDGWTIGGEYGAFGRPLFASDGMLWLAGSDGVRVFNGDNWRAVTPTEMTMDAADDDESTFSQFVIAEADGIVWVGECTYSGPGPVGGLGARWFDGQVWHGADSPAAMGCVTGIAVAPEGSVWLDVGPALYEYLPLENRWLDHGWPQPPQGVLRFGEITDFTFDPAGDPWLELTTCGGASCYVSIVRYHLDRTSASYTQVGTEAELDTRLLFDAAGQGWLFAPGGPFALSDELEPVPGPIPLTLDAVIRSPEGVIWLVGTDTSGLSGLWVRD